MKLFDNKLIAASPHAEKLIKGYSRPLSHIKPGQDINSEFDAWNNLSKTSAIQARCGLGSLAPDSVK